MNLRVSKGSGCEFKKKGKRNGSNWKKGGEKGMVWVKKEGSGRAMVRI